MTKRKDEPVSEKTVGRHFRNAVKKAGAIAFKNHPVTNPGIPDYLVLYNGKAIYVELKTTGEACTPLQIEFHKYLKRRGIDTFVLDHKIDCFVEIMQTGYTSYHGKHWDKNPFRDVQDGTLGVVMPIDPEYFEYL